MRQLKPTHKCLFSTKVSLQHEELGNSQQNVAYHHVAGTIMIRSLTPDGSTTSPSALQLHSIYEQCFEIALVLFLSDPTVH